jgi:hypothetical protein
MCISTAEELSTFGKFSSHEGPIPEQMLASHIACQ